MQFKEYGIFAHEKELFRGFDIDDLFRNPEDGIAHQEYALSGLADYVEAANIVFEWYCRNYPTILIREMKNYHRGEIDGIYNEPNARRKEFSRAINVSAKITQDRVSFRYRQMGAERKQAIILYFGILNLHSVDYWPRIGDEFNYRGVLYEISLVHVDPTDYWQQTGWPMHVTCHARQIQFGDWSIRPSDHGDIHKDSGAGDHPYRGVGDSTPPAHSEPVTISTVVPDGSPMQEGQAPNAGDNTQQPGHPESNTPGIQIGLPPPDVC